MIDFVLKIIAPNKPVEQYVFSKINDINDTILTYIYDKVYENVRFVVYCGNTKIADFNIKEC